jgi:predicted TIM-barrel fold metal-dependent hydrolase
VRIDSFQSFTPDHPPEHLGPILARNRFEGSIAIGQDPGDPRQFLSLIRDHDFVKAAIPCVDLDDPHLGLLLDELGRVPKFRGVFHRLSDTIPAGLDELARRSLSIDLLPQPVHLPVATEIAERYPALRFAMIGSLPGVADLARFPQAFCKAPGADVKYVLAAFSPSRVMFGSGWPSGLPDHIWKESLARFTQAIGAQPIEVREELLGGAAQHFYRIATL